MFLFIALACSDYNFIPETSLLDKSVDDTVEIEEEPTVQDTGVPNDTPYTCSLSLGWDLNDDGQPVLRLSYEAGASASEARDGDEWQPYYFDLDTLPGHVTNLAAVSIDDLDASPVRAGYTVRFSWQADVDADPNNGNEMPSHGTHDMFGEEGAAWRVIDVVENDVIRVEYLPIVVIETDGTQFSEVTIPSYCEPAEE